MTRARKTGAGLNWKLRLWPAVALLAALVAGTMPAEAAKGKSEAKKAETVTDADRRIEAAIAALESGKTDRAVQELTSAISGGKIAQARLAQALYYRGLAYRKQGKPAQAIADFTSALWIKNGLDPQQRNDALLNRAGAYRDAGLADQAEEDEKRVAATAAAKGQAGAVRAASTQHRVQESAPAPTTSNSGLSNFFSALFGGSPTAQPPADQGFATSVSPAQGVMHPQQVSSWSTETGPAKPEKRAARSTGAKSAAAAQSAAGWEGSTVVSKASVRQAAATPPTTGSTGKAATRIQVAAVRSRQEAQSLAARLAEFGAIQPGKKEVAIEEAVIGNMGTLYRVSLGPFASTSEVQSLCPQLRKAGLDCLVIGQ